MAGKATLIAATALRDRILAFAAAQAGADRNDCQIDDDAVLCGDQRIPLTELAAAAQREGMLLAEASKAYGSPVSIAFNAHGFRAAVNRVTGEVVILQSVHAADAGQVINPVQLRGQVEGAVSHGVGFALTEHIQFGPRGEVLNPNLRNYRIPAFADTPHTEVFFADTYDPIGPFGAKGQGEPPIITVAPALANAVADATGARIRELPLSPDLIFDRVSR